MTALTLPRSPRRLALMSIAASMAFGLCLSAHVLFHWSDGYHQQILASIVKFPLLLISTSTISFAFLHLVARLLKTGLSLSVLARPILAVTAATALTLALLGPVVALCSLTQNYTVVIFVSYGSCCIAIIVGTCAMARHLRRTSISANHVRILTILWLLFFTITFAELGWKLRPLVGWTGQSFTWIRNDPMQLHEQIYYEWLNFRHSGGASFPASPPPPSSQP